jgi:hypothetical protein
MQSMIQNLVREGYTNASRLGGVVCLPLDPKVARSNPAKAMDF